MRKILIALSFVLVLSYPFGACAQTRKPVTSAGANPPASWRGPTAEQKEEIAALRKEVDGVAQQISQAKEEDEKYTGGLIKAQIELRLQILRNTAALLDNRVKALETGSRFVPREVQVASSDQTQLKSLEQDIAQSKESIDATSARSERYSGGLIKAQIESTKATQEQTLAMLQQRYLVAKYGLAVMAPPAEKDAGKSTASASSKGAQPATPPLADTVLSVSLLSKRTVSQKYDKMIILDMDVTASGLDRPARAIKGILKVTDLFGEPKVKINWDFDTPVEVGGVLHERDKGIHYNQFVGEHRWLDSTDQQNMRVVFTVQSILYQDGTRRDF